jgi:hypothetical protein
MMSRMRWVLVAAVALLGFAAGFVATFLAGIEATSAPECDGPCFERWDEVLTLAAVIGTASALLLGLAAWAIVRWRRATRRS